MSCVTLVGRCDIGATVFFGGTMAARRSTANGARSVTLLISRPTSPDFTAVSRPFASRSASPVSRSYATTLCGSGQVPAVSSMLNALMNAMLHSEAP